MQHYTSQLSQPRCALVFNLLEPLTRNCYDPRQQAINTSAALQTIPQSSLPKIFKGDLRYRLGYQFDTLSRYFTSLRLFVAQGQAVRRAILHRLVFTNGSSVEGGVLHPRTDERPLVIASPVRGSRLMLDLGGGHYACYAHCMPGSITVRPGDRVLEGDVIARLGNSGNSTAPHLHFHICDGPDFFWARGVPFVLEAYTKVGEAPGIITPRHDVTQAMMEESTVFGRPCKIRFSKSTLHGET